MLAKALRKVPTDNYITTYPGQGLNGYTVEEAKTVLKKCKSAFYILPSIISNEKQEILELFLEFARNACTCRRNTQINACLCGN